MRRVALLLIAGLVVGCSGPPVKERQQADEAIAAARTADAAIYAPGDLNAAVASLKAYDDAVAQRDFQQALSRALDARDHGYEAAKLAAERKKVVAAGHDALVTDIQALITSAQISLAANRSGRGAAHLRQTLRATTVAMQEASALSDKGDLKGAVKRLTDVPDGLRKELAAFDAANKKIKRTSVPR
jgi:hypothetical protein